MQERRAGCRAPAWTTPRRRRLPRISSFSGNGVIPVYQPIIAQKLSVNTEESRYDGTQYCTTYQRMDMQRAERYFFGGGQKRIDRVRRASCPRPGAEAGFVIVRIVIACLRATRRVSAFPANATSLRRFVSVLLSTRLSARIDNMSVFLTTKLLLAAAMTMSTAKVLIVSSSPNPVAMVLKSCRNRRRTANLGFVTEQFTIEPAVSIDFLSAQAHTNVLWGSSLST